MNLELDVYRAIAKAMGKTIWEHMSAGDKKLLEIYDSVKWEYVDEDDMKNEAARFYPELMTIYINSFFIYNFNPGVFGHIIWHELCHVRQMAEYGRELMEHEENTKNIKRRMKRWIRDEKYQHGRSFKQYMKDCPVKYADVIAWIDLVIGG